MACSAPVGAAMLGCCGGTPPANTSYAGTVKAIAFGQINGSTANKLTRLYRTVNCTVAYSGPGADPGWGYSYSMTLPQNLFQGTTDWFTETFDGHTGTAGYEWLWARATGGFFASLNLESNSVSPDKLREETVQYNRDFPDRKGTIITTLSNPVAVAKADIYAHFSAQNAWGKTIHYYPDGTVRAIDNVASAPFDSAYWQYDTGGSPASEQVKIFFGIAPFAPQRAPSAGMVAIDNHRLGPGATIYGFTARFTKGFYRYLGGAPLCLVKWDGITTPLANPALTTAPLSCQAGIVQSTLVEIQAATNDWTVQSRSALFPPQTVNKPSCCNLAP